MSSPTRARRTPRPSAPRSSPTTCARRRSGPRSSARPPSATAARRVGQQRRHLPAGQAARHVLDDYRHMIDVNQIGVFLGMKAVAPTMVAQQSGSIVNISSIAGLLASPNAFAYGASKFAVRGMTKSAAVELARANVRVNSIHPGLIETDMMTEVTGGDADPSRPLRRHRAVASHGGTRRGRLPRALTSPPTRAATAPAPSSSSTAASPSPDSGLSRPYRAQVVGQRSRSGDPSATRRTGRGRNRGSSLPSA